MRSYSPHNRHRAQQIRMDLVAGLGLRRARTAIERLYPHPPHQRLHVTTADLAPIGRQKVSQHPRSREWELQMQPVETPHDREVGAAGTPKARSREHIQPFFSFHMRSYRCFRPFR